MIIALLFLILFAILFPKALRFLFALLFIGMIAALGAAHAGYDCHDGKFDDCTAQWRRDHAPSGAVPLCLKWPCENGDKPVVETHASVDCQDIAARQVASEPGITQCFAAKTLSPDCKAVTHASMIKRIHECEKAVDEFRHPHHN